MKALLLGAMLVGSCVLPQVVPEARGEFTATGTIARGELKSGFDASRVVSPNLELARRTDGSWGGRFSQAGSGLTQALDVSVEGDVVRGVDFLMRRERAGERTIITGTFKAKSFRFELWKDGFSAHTTRYSADFAGRQAQPDGSIRFGDEGALVMSGTATALDPVAWPQLAFALFGAFY
jgi:hypothetical protein